MIPGILAACPTLERYRTLSHNTLEALGLPRRPFRVKLRRTQSEPMFSALPPNSDGSVAHSITSSAKANNDAGIVRWSNLAVCILIRNDR